MAGRRDQLRREHFANPETAARVLGSTLLDIYFRLEALERRVTPDAVLTIIEESGVVDVTQLWTNGPIKASTVTVPATDTATLLPTAALTNRRKVVLKNFGANAVYLGGSTVTVAAGTPLDTGQEIDLLVGPSSLIYGIVSASDAAVDVRILEFS